MWTFRTREMTFSSGAPVTAADVAASLNRLAARGVDSLSGPGLSVVAGYQSVAAGASESMSGVVALDERTVEITLAEPYESLPELLAGVSFGIFPVDIDTSGSLPLSSSVRFTPSAMWEDGFRMVAEPIEGEISTIELWADPTGELVSDGDVDIAVGLDPEAMTSVPSLLVPRAADAYFAMNAAVPPFDDPKVRQAIVHAVDRKSLLDEFFPAADLMLALVPEALPGGSEDACGGVCAHRPTRAQRFVSESAGSATPLTVDYFVTGDGDDTEQRLAEAVVAALRDAGLIATARAHPVEDYGTRIANGELGLFRFGSVSTVPSADFELAASFLTAGADNVTSTKLDDFDALVGQARAEENAVARADLYRSADALLMDQAVVLPLVRFTEQVWHSTAVSMVGLELDGSLDLASISFS